MRLVLFAVCLAGVVLAAQPAHVRQVVLTGEVGSSDKGTYQEHAFEVPAGVTRLDIEFTHTHKDDGTELEIGLFDPLRFRGTSRFSKAQFHVAERHATPSYMSGPILPGRWRVSIGVPSIGATTRALWRVTVRMSSGDGPQEGLARILRPATEWYVGDLHAHTLHSDAFGCRDSSGDAARGCQPWEVVEAARARGLDFLAITDHNTMSHHADLATLQESLDDVLLLRGQELTTFRGHANVFGTSTFVDFRLGYKGRTMDRIVDDVRDTGGLLSINHPARDTGDRCTGCGWDAPGTPWDRIESLEVVNGATVEGPNAGLPFWYARLNEGHHITAIGGSDDHAGRSEQGHIGSPATVVFARNLSEAAILDGIRAGQAYVRTRGPEGPGLEVVATSAGQRVAMGGTLAATPDVTVALDVHVTRAVGQTLQVVRNGVLIGSVPVRGPDERLTQTVALTTRQWVHLLLRDARGLTAIANPVYRR
jgi:hypothetical protein